MLEKDIEQYAVKKFKLYNFEAIKYIDPRRRGAPDRKVIDSENKLDKFYIEFKREEGNYGVTPHQIDYARQLTKKGHDVYLLKSKEEVDLFLERLVFYRLHYSHLSSYVELESFLLLRREGFTVGW